MGEQKHFRSEQARKNYEKSERQRAAAQKRKARRAKSSKVTGAIAEWFDANKKKVGIIVLVAVLVIAGLWLGVKAATNPLKGKQDNWLILDVSASSKTHNYQHLADFTIPAGYTQTDYSLYSDGVQQDFFCVADDPARLVQDVYVTGAKGIVASQYPATILAYGIHKEAGEPRTLTINGMECSMLYLVSDESEWSGEGMAIAHLSFYFDTGKNACVSATFRSGTMPADQLPDEDAMLAEAEALISGLTLIK